MKGARLQSLCGTNRRLRKEEELAAAPKNARRPCRYHAIWACQGPGERERRPPDSQRCARTQGAPRL